MAKNRKSSDEQYTKEATFGTLPVRRSERQYGMLDAFLVLSGYGVATWCYTQGTFQAAYCNFKQLLTTTFAANIFVLALYLLPVLLCGNGLSLHLAQKEPELLHWFSPQLISRGLDNVQRYLQTQ